MFIILEALFLCIDHPLVPPLVVFLGVKGSSELEFEYFLLDVGGLVIFGVFGVGLLEVEFVEVVLVIGQQFLLVQKLG